MTGHGSLDSGDWLAVFGCGGLGLSAVLIGTALGARVVAVDPSPAARRRALELGAQTALEPDGAVAAIRQLTDGGARLSLDALGSARTAADSVRSLRRRGLHVQAGLMLGADASAALPWELVIAHELRVQGSHGMAAADYPAMIELVASGRLRPERLIGPVIGLEQAGAALMAMDDPVPVAAGATVIVVAGPTMAGSGT